MRAIAIVAATVLASSANAQQPERGSDPHVRAVIQGALDDSFHDQIQHLFASWMKDATGQPERAAAGIRKAVAAYRHAIHAIETEKLTWDAPPLPRPRPHAALQ